MIWKDIPNFNGYQVSDTGLVRTYNKITHTAKHGDRNWQNRILKPKQTYKKRGGDARVDLWRDGKAYGFKISRLVAFTFYGEDINNHKLTVNHIDGNWKNNNLSNLELISLADNIKHGFETGLYSKSCIKVKMVDKKTNIVKEYRSLSEASRAIGYCAKYLSSLKAKGIYETEDFRWQV